MILTFWSVVLKKGKVLSGSCVTIGDENLLSGLTRTEFNDLFVPKDGR